MSGVMFEAVTAEIATGTSAKTLLQVVAASNHRILIKELSISFDGTNNAHAPIQVRVLRQTSAGTMSALTVVKGNDSDDETLQTTAQHTSTSEPTSGDVLATYFVHPQTGFLWQAPFGRKIVVKGGGRIGVEVTAANDVGAVVTVKGEE